MSPIQITNNNFWQKYNYLLDGVYLFKYGNFRHYSYGHLNGKIDFKRNVHLNLVDSLQGFGLVQENIYGIAVVFSKYDSTNYNLENRNDEYLLHGLTGIFAIIFQFNTKKVAIYDCLKTVCDMKKPTTSKSGVNYEGGQYNWHILYSYSQKTVSVYSGSPSISSNLLLKYDNIQIATIFPSGLGYIGLTATDYLFDYYHAITGSYICCNEGKAIEPKVTLSADGETIIPGQEIEVSPSSPIQIIATYATETEASIMGKGSLIIKGVDETNLITQEKEQYSATYYPGIEIGPFEVIYKTVYTEYKFNVVVKAGEASSIRYYYGKEESEGECFIKEGDYRVLQYGVLKDIRKTGCGGDFELAEFRDEKYLSFYVRSYDKHGNLAPINSDNLIEFTELEAVLNGNNVDVKMEKISDYLYKVSVLVTQKGTYVVTSIMLDNKIKFVVKNYMPEKASCTFAQPKSYVYVSGEGVVLTCSFKDQAQEDIDINVAKEELGIEFDAKINRQKEGKDEVSFPVDKEEIDGKKIIYTFYPKYNGDYKFLSGYRATPISQEKWWWYSFDLFYVAPMPKSLESSRYYNYQTSSWVAKEKLSSEIFLYPNGDSTGDIMFGIDLVDIDDPNKTSFADMTKGYTNFDWSKFIGEISESHSGYKNKLSFEKGKIGSKEYVIVKLANAKTEIRRTSYEYSINVKLNEDQSILKFKIILDHVGDYTACRKDVSPSNSILSLSKDTFSMTAGDILSIGELVLRTECEEGHLYNYFLENEKQISYLVHDKNEKEFSDYSIFIDKSNEIYGVYKMRFSTKVANEFTVEVLLNSEKIKSDFNSYKVTVNPIKKVFYLIKISDEKKKDYDVETVSKFDFQLQDEFKNLITYPLSSPNLDNDLGITYTISVDGSDITNILKNTKYIQLVKNDNEDFYSIKDTYPIMGDYVITLGTKYSSNKISFSYYKRPGIPVASKSKITMISPKQLLIEEKATVKIDLFDNYNNYIGKDLEKLKEYESLIKVIAQSSIQDLPNIDFKPKEISGTSYLFETAPIYDVDKYYIKGFINNVQVEISDYFEVVDYGFSFRSSQLRMVMENSLIMTENGYYTIFSGLQKPGFEFSFLTSEGNPSQSLDPNIYINAVLSLFNGSGNEVTLDINWLSNNKIFWNIPESYTLSPGNVYVLRVITTDETELDLEKEFYLTAVEYGNEASEDDSYEITNTLVSPTVLYTTAGEVAEVLIELKTKNGLRYNKNLDLSKLKITHPQLGKDIIVNVKEGSSKGQIILSIINYVPTMFNQEVSVSLSYNNEEIKSKIILVTSNNKLSYFLIDPSCLENEDENSKVLKPSFIKNMNQIILIPYDEFGNLVKGNLFDEEIYPPNSLSYLFNLEHSKQGKTKLSSSTLPQNLNLILSPYTNKVGVLTLSSVYLKYEYTMNVTGEDSEDEGEEGKIDDTNSYLEVKNSAEAGDEIEVLIHCFDGKNQRINFDVEKDVEFLTYFELYERYEENSNNDFRLINKEKAELVNIDGKSLIRYKTKVYKKGINQFRAIFKETENIIKCKNCELKVNEGEFDIEKTEIFSYDVFSSSYKLISPETALYNYNQKLMLKIYPKDSYGNSLSLDSLKELDTFDAKFSGIELTKNILSIGNYIEFIDFKGEFANLKGGEYNLVLNYNFVSREIKLTVAGDPKEEFFTNSEVDLKKSLILDNSHLEFNVGEYGYFVFELKNKNRVRFNSEKTISPIQNLEIISEQDPALESKILGQKSSTIIVLIKTLKANSFPVKNEFSISVILNSIPTFSSEILVKPGNLHLAKIEEKYIEKPFILKSVTADELFRFSVKGQDKYGNPTYVSENLLKINLANYLYTNNNFISGEQIYVYSITKSGTYEISAGAYFEQNYKVTIEPGEVSPELSRIQVVTHSLRAGEEAIATVSPTDKYNNPINSNIETNKFKLYLSLDDEKFEVKDISFENYKILFKIVLTKAGAYKWSASLNEKKLRFEDTSTVTAAICHPENTIIFYRNSKGEYVEMTTMENLYSHVTLPLSVHLVLRDKYKNIIEKVNEDEIQVKEIYLSGNNMKNPLNWNKKLKSDSSQIYLDLDTNDATKKQIFEHLVQRTGAQAYDFTFTINDYIFYLKVDHYTQKDDVDYGNGDYTFTNSVLAPLKDNTISFRVGTELTLNLELRTSEGLLYNNDIDLNKDFSCGKLLPENYQDSSFKCSIKKKGNNYGKYEIIYYSEKVKFIEEKIKNQIYLLNLETTQVELFKEINIENDYEVPFKAVVKEKLPEKINDENKPIISYQLYDKFNNLYKNQKSIIEFLFFYNNNAKAGHSTTLSQEGDVYKSDLVLTYVEKEIRIQLKYEKNEISNKLFTEEQQSEFDYKLDIKNTKVTSDNHRQMKAGELLDLKVYLYDEKNHCYSDDSFDPGLISAFVQGPLGTETEKIYSFKKVKNSEKVCNIFYVINISDSNKYTTAGNYTIKVIAGEEKYLCQTYIQLVTPGEIAPSKFKVYYEDRKEKIDYNAIQAGSSIYYLIQAYDIYNNIITDVQIQGFSIKIEAIDSSGDVIDIDPDSYLIKINTYSFGRLRGSFMATKALSYKFYYFYKNEGIIIEDNQGPDVVTYISGPCSNKIPKIEYPEDEMQTLSLDYIYNITCFDEYNNELKTGGAKFVSQVRLRKNQITIDIETKIVDNKNGKYHIIFTPPLIGEYSIYTYLNDEKYDKEYIFNLTQKECTEFTCPNNDKCVSDLRECIPEEYRCDDEAEKEKKPFKCPVDGVEQCVKSMVDCDYDKDKYYRCGHMNVLVPKEYEYDCPFEIPINCKRTYPKYPEYCNDGICRLKVEYGPNQRVCPIGTYMCSDMTCQKNLDDCYIYKQSADSDIVCVDQSVVKKQEECPSTITCRNSEDVVCPDGTCVENEIYCPALKVCPDETPYLCPDNSCANNPRNCPKTTACGHGLSLCEDLICREVC